MKQSPLPTAPRAAVIGSGFGGLALAIRLQSAGIDTTLFEARDKPGGRAYVYEQDGFTFDAGPTVITAPDALEELFTLSGRQLKDYVNIVPIQPFYRLCWEDGTSFDYTNKDDELFAQIAARNPADVDGYKRFMKFSEEAYREGYIKLGALPFLDIWSMVKAAPQLTKLEGYRSVYAMVARFIKDEKLRQAFSFHTLLVGGNPYQTSSVYALIHALEKQGGVHFAMGGTGALVRGFAKLFTDLGGTLHLNAKVSRIGTSNGRVDSVTTEDGRTERFDMVASNADIIHTYKHLLKDDRTAVSTGKRMEGKRFSNSLFVIYFGLKGDVPGLAHHSVLFGPRYKGLLSDIYSKGVLAEDFSLYLHAPSVTDPSLAPEGHASYYVLSPVPHLGKADIDWEVEGPKYRDRILHYLEDRYIPNLKRDLVTSRIFTPFDFRDTLNAHHGSAFSLEPVLTQSAYFRTHNRDDKIGGLYFVGAGTHPGAGIPGVVGSAKATAGLMIDDAGPLAQARPSANETAPLKASA